MKSAAASKALLGLLTAFAVALGGCAAGPNYHTPKPDTPPAFVASVPASAATCGGGIDGGHRARQPRRILPRGGAP